MTMSLFPSPPQATRAIHELLLEPSRRMEVQTLFPLLFMALLFQISFLVVEGGASAAQDEQQATEWLDPVRYLHLQGPPAKHPPPGIPCHRPTWAQPRPGHWVPHTPF